MAESALTLPSTNLVTTKPQTRWTHTKGLRTWILPTSTSRRGYSFCGIMVNPQVCLTSIVLLSRKMSTHSSTKRLAWELLPVHSGGLLVLRQCNRDLVPLQLAPIKTGVAGWQRFSTPNLNPNPRIHMINARLSDHPQLHDKSVRDRSR